MTKSSLSEADFQRRVMDAAVVHGWLVHHMRPARRKDGKWVSPMEGHAGFPDLVLARRGCVILAELKSATGRPSPEQVEWLEQLGGHGRLWRPRDWADVLAELQSVVTP